MLIEVPKRLFNEDAKQKFDAATNNAERRRIAIKDHQKKIDELEHENTCIAQTTIKFAGFLKKNCMIPVNDAFVPYLQQQIGEENRKLEPNKAVIKAMEQSIGMKHSRGSRIEVQYC